MPLAPAPPKGGWRTHALCPLVCCSGRTAKELSVQLLEGGDDPAPCTRLEHANYLGRELQRAELALSLGADYIQD